MAKYDSLPDLRAALTTDDPDERAEAYGAVLNADLEVSDVLSDSPPEQTLIDEGVIPKPDRNPNEPEAAEIRQEQVQLLKEIRDAVTGGK